MQPSTMDIMRKLMRLVVTDGFGKNAEVAGYYPGGKTGTAEKVGKHGYQRGFKENFNVAAFTSVFPMNAPRYAVYMMLDEPHGNKSTYGFSTAGWVAAPAAGRGDRAHGADDGACCRTSRTCRRSTRCWRSRWSQAVRRERRCAALDRRNRQNAGAIAPAPKPDLTVPARILPPAGVRVAPRHEANSSPSPAAAGAGQGEGAAPRTPTLLRSPPRE